jgi:hypothetical protein
VGGAEAAHDTANVEGIAVRLCDPLYFLTIIEIWKVLGAIVILIPRTPRLNEWAAPGIFSPAAPPHMRRRQITARSCFML